MAFQDLKRYLTSPPVMVAPSPLEPLVLYLATTPHSASTALVVVREERLAKGSWSSTSHLIQTWQPQDGAPAAFATPKNDQAPQDGAPEASVAPRDDQVPLDDTPKASATPTNNQASEIPQSQEV